MPNYNLGTASGRIVLDASGAVLGAGQAEAAAGKVGGSFGKASGAAIKAGGVLTAGAAAVAVGFGAAIHSAADFEKQISGIAAVSGATGPELEDIRKKALQLGKDTQFSASEAANAIEELVKAGIPVADVLNGAADAAVSLAAAGGVGIPEAATLAANAMNAFGINAKDLGGVVDQIAGAANASAIDVGEFGQSLQQVGAVAHLAGLSFDDTAVAIAELGNAGIKGSDAGTSLKTFLQNLIPVTDKEKGLMQDLGIISVDTTTAMKTLAKNGIKPASDSFDDIISAIEKYNAANGGAKVGTEKAGKEALIYAQSLGVVKNQFFDAQGNTKKLADLQNVLAGALHGMSKEQKLATLQTLFGSDAIRAASVLADNAGDKYTKLNDAINSTSAADVAKKRMSSTAYVNNNGVTQAQLTVSWSAVTTNSDGTAIDDLAGYEVQVARVSGQWVPMGRTDSSTTAAYSSGYEPGITLYARVRAYDTNGNVSAWSATASTTAGTDVTAPNTPSTPTVDGSAFLGTLRITWDGKDSGGAAMPADFAVLEVHASTVNNFTPSIAAGSSTKIDEYQQAIPSVTSFAATIGVTTYVKFVAVDKVGNRSTVSAQGSGTARAGVDADFASISAGKITAGSLVADITVAARIKTANTGARVELNSAGLYAYNSSNVQTVGIDASTGAATFTGTITGSTITGGTFKTVASGQRIELSTSFASQIKFYSGNASETSPGLLYIDNTGYVYWTTATITGAVGTRPYIAMNPSDAGTGGSSFTIAARDVSIVPDNGHPLVVYSNLLDVGAGSASYLRFWTTNHAGTDSYIRVDADGDGTYANATFNVIAGEIVLFAAATGVGTARIRLSSSYQSWGLTLTTGSAANVFYNSTSGEVSKFTSSLKYKRNLRTIDAKQAATILDLKPFRYKSLGGADTNFGTEPSRDFIGLAAEDVDMIGLYEIVEYNADGEPESLMYDRIGAMLIPIVKDLRDRLEVLEKV